MFVYVG